MNRNIIEFKITSSWIIKKYRKEIKNLVREIILKIINTLNALKY